MCVAGREPAEHIRDGDPHVADARTATTLARLNRNDVLVLHRANIALFLRERSASADQLELSLLHILPAAAPPP
jgi:hypothetical protein